MTANSQLANGLLSALTQYTIVYFVRRERIDFGYWMWRHFSRKKLNLFDVFIFNEFPGVENVSITLWAWKWCQFDLNDYYLFLKSNSVGW